MRRTIGDRRLGRVIVAGIGAIALAPVGAFAAAPTLTSLFPAGGQRGSTVLVRCAGEFDWPVRAWAPGVEATPTETEGELRIALPHDLATDRVWLRLFDDQGASRAVPFLIGELPETLEIEPNDSPEEAQRLSEVAAPPNDARRAVNGRLEKSGDVDAFAVELQAGQTLIAAIEANHAFGSPMDAILQATSPDGAVLAENHDGVGLDPRLTFTADATGTYLIRLFAFPAEPNQRIAFHGGDEYVYRLTITTGPYLAHAVVAARDGPPAATPFGWNLPPGVRLAVSPLAEVFRGQEIETVEPTMGPSALLAVVRAPGWAGSARVRTPEAGTPAYDATTGPLPCMNSLPMTIGGRLDAPKGVDLIPLLLQQGEPVVIAVDSPRIDSPLAPRARLSDPDGKIVAETPVSGPVRDLLIEYEPTQSGEHVLAISDRFGHGGPLFYYRLDVRPRRSNFALSLKADAATLTPGQPLEIPVAVSRVRGGDTAIGPITVEAVDLPPGVACPPVVSEPDGDTAAEVVLKLESTGEPFSGPIRIEGDSGEPNRRRRALAPAAFGSRFDSLWLTVLEKPDGG